MERVDPLRAADRLRQVALGFARERLHLAHLAALDDDRPQVQLVQQRPHRVRRRERMLRRGGVARSRPDLQRPRLLPEPLRRRRRQQVRLAGRRAHPQQRTEPRRPELLVEPELLARHVVEAAEVDVVDARRERAAHDGEVEPVVRAVDDDRAAVQPAGDRRPDRTRRAPPPLEPRVPPHERRAPLLEEAGDAAPDRPGGSDDGDHRLRRFERFHRVPAHVDP